MVTRAPHAGAKIVQCGEPAPKGLLALARRNRFEGARLDADLNTAATLRSADERRRAIAAVTHR
jgi:hypothetical protein